MSACVNFLATGIDLNIYAVVSLTFRLIYQNMSTRKHPISGDFTRSTIGASFAAFI